ncbi:Glucose-induced degradation protein 4-like protein [Apiospora arundinis]|uniref:SxtJ n=1 Tax=Apiospora arundinis TaxID=335852 RepID=A0ABR2JBR8_9PEZI
MPISGFRMRDELQQPQNDVVRDMGKVLCWSGMGVSALGPLFSMEGPEYFRAVLIIFSISFSVCLALFWTEIKRNLLPTVIIMLFAIASWYPFTGITLQFVFLRIPLFLTLASIFAVGYGRFPVRFLEPDETPRVPAGIGCLPDRRSGSPQLPLVNGIAFNWMSEHLETSSSMACHSDLSVTSDEITDEELSVFNSDLEAYPRGREQQL